MSEITPHNVFTPALEVQDIERFAGRERELTALVNALQSDGAQLVLYGQRGIGKSSLARVLIRLATNDKEVLERVKIKPYIEFDYLPVYLACDDSIQSIDALLMRLLSDEQALASWLPYKVVERSSSDERNAKLNVKILELGGGSGSSITERRQEIDSDVFSAFSNACRSVVTSGVAARGLLIVIDEFDRIRDRTGLASLLKSLGPEGVTFALVGVATTIQDLISEHESVARQLADGAIHVEPMSYAELGEIIDRAMKALGEKYSFEGPARKWIVSIARGHPYIVHLVAKHALLNAIGKGASAVTEKMARDAMEEIALKGSAPIQETLYKTAIGHSYIREAVLKRFAQETQDEIHTTNLYQDLARTLGIDSSAISVYVGQLASDKHGAVLIKTRDRYYRFGDSLFKAYAAARPFERKQGEIEPEA
mgnify:CR=1 FL=1